MKHYLVTSLLLAAVILSAAGCGNPEDAVKKQVKQQARKIAEDEIARFAEAEAKRLAQEISQLDKQSRKLIGSWKAEEPGVPPYFKFSEEVVTYSPDGTFTSEATWDESERRATGESTLRLSGTWRILGDELHTAFTKQEGRVIFLDQEFDFVRLVSISTIEELDQDTLVVRNSDGDVDRYTRRKQEN